MLAERTRVRVADPEELMRCHKVPCSLPWDSHRPVSACSTSPPGPFSTELVAPTCPPLPGPRRHPPTRGTALRDLPRRGYRGRPRCSTLSSRSPTLSPQAVIGDAACPTWSRDWRVDRRLIRPARDELLCLACTLGSAHIPKFADGVPLPDGGSRGAETARECRGSVRYTVSGPRTSGPPQAAASAGRRPTHERMSRRSPRLHPGCRSARRA